MTRHPKSCWKCATDQPHPFRHWHVRCPICRTPKIFRGPACKPCHDLGKELIETIMRELRGEQ